MNFENLLNEEQQKAVIQTEGAVLVLAGAGSGKTRVLTHRIAHLIFNLSVSPRNILAITFTNKAANEMKERLASFGVSSNEIWVCTIHSMCNRILRMFGDRIGFSKNFTIYTEQEKDKIIKRICSEMQIDDEGFIKKCRFHISNAKNNNLLPEEYRKEYKFDRAIDEICTVYANYQDILKNNNSMDFDDLLCKSYELLKTDLETREFLSQKFRYIHIDEFQDTNKIQYQLVCLLASHHKNLFTVGDDDQSIYSFRGAVVENIFHFQKDFPNCKIFKLQRNYRSTKKILNAANTIIKNNSKRMDKTLYTENEEGADIEFYSAGDETAEANFVISQINSLKTYGGYKFSDMAILMRINALSRAFEQECLKYGIAVRVYGGFKFFERKEIKDITAYLSVIVNPDDEESLLRIINTPKRGIAEGTLIKLFESKTQGESLFDAIMSIDRKEGIPNALLKKILPVKNLFLDLLISSETMRISEFVRHLIKATGLRDAYNPHDDESYNKLLNIDEFINSVTEFEKINKDATLSDYLADVSLASDPDIENENDTLTISTVHAAKGLEFGVVFIVGLDEGIFPVSRMDEVDIDEERRLLYVAVTRAKKRLFLLRSNSRFLYGDRKYLLPSKFLAEMKIIDTKAAPLSAKQYQPQKADNAKNFQPKFERNFSASGSASSFPASSGSKKDISGFVPGAKVIHKTFGEGTVLSLKKDNYNTYCEVAFAGVGIKTLALQFAPIELK